MDTTEITTGKKSYKKLTKVLVVIAILICCYYGIRFIKDSFLYESTDDAFIEGRVVAISPKVAGHVLKLFITDNQRVKKGDPLLEIDPRDYQTQLHQAQASLEASKAAAEQLEAAILAAKAEANRAQIESGRYQELSSTNSVSKQQLDNAVASSDVAAARLVAATKESAVAKARIAQAQALLEQAELSLSYTKIYAPQDGRVTNRAVEEGAYVEKGQPLLAIVPFDVWVVANFKETQLEDIRPGQKVKIRVDAVPHLRLNGHVDSIQAGTGARFSLLPPENATGNYVKVVQRVPVKIICDADPNQLEMLTPGMSVIPKIRIKSVEQQKK